MKKKQITYEKNRKIKKQEDAFKWNVHILNSCIINYPKSIGLSQ